MVDAGGEVPVAFLGNLSEAGGIERGAVDDLALIDLTGLQIVGGAVLGVGDVQSQGLALVAVAAAVRAHIVKHVLALLVEHHHREIGVFLHKLEGVAGGCHIHRDGVDVVSPHVAERAPADGHRVVVLLVAGGQQQAAALEPGEGVAGELFRAVELLEVGLFGCFRIAAALLGARRGTGNQCRHTDQDAHTKGVDGFHTIRSL